MANDTPTTGAPHLIEGVPVVDLTRLVADLRAESHRLRERADDCDRMASDCNRIASDLRSTSSLCAALANVLSGHG